MQDIISKRIRALSRSSSSSTMESKHSSASSSSSSLNGLHHQSQCIDNENNINDDCENDDSHNMPYYSFTSNNKKMKKTDSYLAKSKRSNHKKLNAVRLLSNGHRISKLNPEYYNDCRCKSTSNISLDFKSSSSNGSNNTNNGNTNETSIYDIAMKNRFISGRNHFMNFDSY